MDVGFDDLKAAFDLIRSAVGLANDTKDLLPAGPKKDAVTKGLAEAELATQLAEAQIAKSLGYPLCRCTFPPQIMLSKGWVDVDYDPSEIFQCPECGTAI